jgi:hypothetical protein
MSRNSEIVMSIIGQASEPHASALERVEIDRGTGSAMRGWREEEGPMARGVIPVPNEVAAVEGNRTRRGRYDERYGVVFRH